MRRGRQLSPPGEPEHLPSTTRAVAWGAMFFAFLAFVISLATLFLTYKDGRLVDNFNKLAGEFKSALPAKTAAKSGDDQTAMRAEVRGQLDRYADMIRSGNTQARYYLDNLGSDLSRLRAYGSEDARKWIADAQKTVESARDEMRDNAPEAAQKLRDLSQRLGGAVSDLHEAIASKTSGAAKPDATPAATPAPGDRAEP